MINTGLPRYITLRLWGERTGKEEGGEGGKEESSDGGVFGRARTTLLHRGSGGKSGLRARRGGVGEI